MTKAVHKHKGALLTILCSSLMGTAQNARIPRDSSDIAVNYFKDDFKEHYSGDEFNYNINDTGGVNLIQQILRKLFGWLGDLFGFDIDFLDYQTLEYIVYGLLSVVVLYLLTKFLLQNPVSNIFKKETKTIEGFSYVEEDIKQINFDKYIKDALKSNNYRLATRYLYLKSLKALANRGTIEWHFEKTNSDYLNEIKDINLKTSFKRVSYIYDYVWYGEFPIDETRFNKNKDDFNQLLKSTQNG